MALVICLAMATHETRLAADPIPPTPDALDDGAEVSLSQALETLRQQGLDLVYTNRLVRPGMRVDGSFLARNLLAPTGSTRGDRGKRATAVLEALLEPHGLAAQQGSRGQWVVVQRAEARPKGRLRGRVVHEDSGMALPGIEVLPPGQAPVRTDQQGYFELEVASGTFDLEARGQGFEPSRLEGIRIVPGGLTEVEIALQLEAHDARIVVLASNSPDDLDTGRHIDPEQIESLGLLRGDLLAAVGWLPGTSGSADGGAFGVRGEDSSAVMLVVDGQEIVEPYHLRDFGDLVGILAPTTVAQARLHTGPLPAEWGDRSGAVLEVITTWPEGYFHGRAAASENVAQAGLGGTALGDRGRWFGSYRQGEPNLARQRSESRLEPTYWDAFAKLAFASSERQDWSLHGLESDDRLFFLDFVQSGEEQFITDHEASHLWLRHSFLATPRHSLETQLFESRIQRSRFGIERPINFGLGAGDGPDEDSFAIEDTRRSRRHGLRLEVDSWFLSRGWSSGLEIRREEADYRYQDLLPTLGPNPPPAPDPELESSADRSFQGWHVAAFGSTRWQVAQSWSLEASLRLDRSGIPQELLASPRIALAKSSDKGIWRAGLGLYHQGQRAYELDMPDGERLLQEAEHATLLTLGHSRQWGAGTELGIEIYARDIRHPHRRFHNLYSADSRFPEVESDRIRLEPERGRAAGLEMIASRRWAGFHLRGYYALAMAEEKLEGRWYPRPGDRRSSLRLDAEIDLPRGVDLALTWSSRSGAPATFPNQETTPSQASDTGLDTGYHQDRFPDEHRLDLRLRRAWDLGRLGIGLDLGVDNVFDRRPIRGFATDLESPPLPELGLGATFRAGLRIEF